MLDRRCDTGFGEFVTKDLTVALDEKSYRKAKTFAVERGVSVSAQVHDYFATLESESTIPREPARKRKLVDRIGDHQLADVALDVPGGTETPSPAKFD